MNSEIKSYITLNYSLSPLMLPAGPLQNPDLLMAEKMK